MASGNSVVEIIDVLPPAANSPLLTVRQGGSTPAERIRIWSFDASTIEYLDFLCKLRGYGSGGLTWRFEWSAASATGNVTRWEIALRRMQDDAEDIDTSQTYDFNAVDATAPDVSGEISYDTIAMTDGADMDSVANGEIFIARLRRNASHANDTMTGDAELWSLEGTET